MAEAAKDKPPRKPRQSNRVAAVENALDVLADYLHSLEDADAKAALVERIIAITRPHSEAWKRRRADGVEAHPEPDMPNKKKGRGKRPKVVARIPSIGDVRMED
jgi:hypothetical protein